MVVTFRKLRIRGGWNVDWVLEQTTPAVNGRWSIPQAAAGVDPLAWLPIPCTIGERLDVLNFLWIPRRSVVRRSYGVS